MRYWVMGVVRMARLFRVAARPNGTKLVSYLVVLHTIARVSPISLVLSFLLPFFVKSMLFWQKLNFVKYVK